MLSTHMALRKWSLPFFSTKIWLLPDPDTKGNPPVLMTTAEILTTDLLGFAGLLLTGFPVSASALGRNAGRGWGKSPASTPNS